MEEKVLRYEAFVTDTLQRDLSRVLENRDNIYEKISQYLQLKNIIERLQELDSGPLKTQVDLGCNFYVNAEVFVISCKMQYGYAEQFCTKMVYRMPTSEM